MNHLNRLNKIMENFLYTVLYQDKYWKFFFVPLGIELKASCLAFYHSHAWFFFFFGFWFFIFKQGLPLALPGVASSCSLSTSTS
jgi:hypothetical protein